MILINFTHPLAQEGIDRIESLLGQPVERTVEAPAQFDHERPFTEQVVELVERTGITAREWQTDPLLVVPPALNFIAVAVLAEIHGRAGYFVPVVRTRPVEGSLPPRYEVAEILNLQAIRDRARKRR